jgi:hypothetical protein
MFPILDKDIGIVRDNEFKAYSIDDKYPQDRIFFMNFTIFLMTMFRFIYLPKKKPHKSFPANRAH